MSLELNQSNFRGPVQAWEAFEFVLSYFFCFRTCSAVSRIPKNIRDPMPHVAAFHWMTLKTASRASSAISTMSVVPAVRCCCVFKSLNSLYYRHCAPRTVPAQVVSMSRRLLLLQIPPFAPTHADADATIVSARPHPIPSVAPQIVVARAADPPATRTCCSLGVNSIHGPLRAGPALM